MRRPKSDYSIQTVTNALRLLEAFRDEEELGVTELARRLDLHKNNVFRLLATLEGKGYVEQSPTSDRYRLGVGCLEIGQAFSRTRSLLRLARPYLEELVTVLGESAHLATLRDWNVVHLAGEQAAGPLVVSGLRVGSQLPVHCTALGKVLLGSAEAETRDRYDRDRVRGHKLEQRTPATLVDREKLFDALREVGNQGYATDCEEYEPGLCCAAAPVTDAAGSVVGALSVSGPSYRLTPDHLHQQVVPTVRQAAESLSRQLGRA